MKVDNLFAVPAEKIESEIFQKILETKNFYIEKIISEGNSSPEGFWYNQSTNELVFLLTGSAEIEFDNEKIELNPGDYILIPSYKKHRVSRTDKYKKTIWLAIHFDENKSGT